MNRRGVALLLAVIALAVLGTVAETSLALALAESSIGRARLAEVGARAMAESASAAAFLGWPAALTPADPGDTLLLSAVSGRGEGRAVLRSLGGPIFAIEATGSSTVRIRSELLIRLDSVPGDSLVYPHSIPRGWRRIP